MQDDTMAGDRAPGQQDSLGPDDRQRLLRAQQEAQEREQQEQDEADARSRHRIRGAIPAAGPAVHEDLGITATQRSPVDTGAQQGGRGRAIVLGVAMVFALAFAGYKYTRSPSKPMATVAGSESPLTAGLPSLADEPPRADPAEGPALPSAPSAIQPGPAGTGGLVGQVSHALQPQNGTGAETAPVADEVLQKRVASVETVVQELREQLTRLEGRQAELAAQAAAPRPAARVRTAARPVASAPPAPEHVAPQLAGRLLAVDSWGGAPSVVVGTGVPGDKRIRVMRPGDTYNGVSLLDADSSRGEATFIANGRSFRLTLQDVE